MKQHMYSLFIRATASERKRRLPGDERIPHAVDSITHGITIDCTPRGLWPWLVQMGAGNRGGWYSYDRLDNGNRPSADHIRAELQDPPIGTIFPALPGVTEGFVLAALKREQYLTLIWPERDGRANVTWTFVLEAINSRQTRLLVRVRGGQGYRLFGLPVLVSRILHRCAHFVMQRKQLIGLTDRAA